MRLRHLVLTLLLILFWGFNWVTIKIGLNGGVSPVTLCFARYFFASLPAIFFIRRPQIPLQILIAYGLIMFALQFVLLFAGIYLGVAVGLASLISQQGQIFFTLILVAIFCGEKPNKWQIIGILTSFIGIGIIAINLHASASITGALLVVASSAAWGTGNLIAKKMPATNMLAVVVWSSLFAWPPMLLLAIFGEGAHSFVNSFIHLPWLSLVSIIYLAYVATLFGYGTWSFLLNRYPAATVVPFTLLVPIVASISSAIVLGEQIKSWEILAGTIIILGLCINLFFSRLLSFCLVKLGARR
ncbi:MAG: EamA family transporter [Gammaproteobacteria bacterium]|nr:EamA family transporter [Gammaproteobacteria bacterium]